MRPHRASHPRSKPAALLAPLWLAVAGPLAAADEAALQRCRALADAGARLACYDALPVPAVPPSTPVATRSPVPSPAPAPAAAATAVPPAVQAFGQARKDEPSAITSHIPGPFEGWGPRTRITLANGQVWQVVDDSSGVYMLKDPKVTVRRAVMGGFVMDIEGANRVPRVRRVD